MRDYNISLKEGSFILTNSAGQWEILTGPFIIIPIEGGINRNEFNADLKMFLDKYFKKEILDRNVYYSNFIKSIG